MGLKFTDPFVASSVDTLVIVSAINNAASRIKGNQANAALQRWFGDSSPAWKQAALQNLEKLRRIINLQEISVGVSRLSDRSRAENANALPGSATSIVPGTNTVDPLPLVQLNSAFLKLPRYLPRTGGTVDTGVFDAAKCNNQSMFETVVHELTHVILSTNDENLLNGDTAYGTNRALQLVGENAALAKTNAENWGCFIEACGKFNGS